MSRILREFFLAETRASPLLGVRRMNETIEIAHGGERVRTLQEQIFAKLDASPSAQQDSTVLGLGASQVAFTTDSYVVRPLFFPGGDAGKLAVVGAVNDLAMSGARPRWLSVAFILEEGLPLETLDRIVASMSAAAREVGVVVVTGDTKVIERRSREPELIITTAGLGQVAPDVDVQPARVRPGDLVIVSGDVGRHGIAVLAAREGLDIDVVSDCAPVDRIVASLLDVQGSHVHCLRDAERGGLALALEEVSRLASVRIDLDPTSVPVHPNVLRGCELLGLDPLSVPNEGRFVAFVDAAHAQAALRTLRAHPLGREAAIVGHVSKGEGVIVRGERLFVTPSPARTC